METMGEIQLLLSLAVSAFLPEHFRHSEALEWLF